MKNPEGPIRHGPNLYRIGDEFAYRDGTKWVALGTTDLATAKDRMSLLGNARLTEDGEPLDKDTDQDGWAK